MALLFHQTTNAAVQEKHQVRKNVEKDHKNVDVFVEASAKPSLEVLNEHLKYSAVCCRVKVACKRLYLAQSVAKNSIDVVKVIYTSLQAIHISSVSGFSRLDGCDQSSKFGVVVCPGLGKVASQSLCLSINWGSITSRTRQLSRVIYGYVGTRGGRNKLKDYVSASNEIVQCC